MIAFQLNLVGASGGVTANLTSGAGVITYTASTPMTVENTQPKFTTAQGIHTAENANCAYGQLPQCPCRTFIQTFEATH